MAQTNTRSSQNIRQRFNEPEKYAVVMLNDDFTTMEFVIDVLMKVFFKPYDEASRLMMTIHVEGEAVVGLYPLDIAKSKVLKVTRMAQEAGAPLKLIIREA